MTRSGTPRSGFVHAAALLLGSLVATTAHAQADGSGWQWLRSKNRRVEKGNERMAAGDAKGALEHYDAAARELPGESGVHLNRGLALLSTGDLAGAREALRLALEPPASPGVRADAHDDLGIAFFREADALAAEERHEEAQKLFREAVDAFRQSLRLRSGDRDVAWNLELAARRLQEQEEKQRQKEEQEKQEQEQEQDQDQDQDQEQKDQSDPSQDDGQKPGEQGEEPPQGGQDPQQEKQEGPKQNEEKKKEDGTKDPQKPEAPPSKTNEPERREETPEATPAVPSDVTHTLDALQDSEQNLERIKAQMRARREQRRPEKDW